MTAACPDWAALVREREHAERSLEGGVSAIDRAWEDALRHREDCGHCRAVSLQVDPLLLFSGDFTGARDRNGMPDGAPDDMPGEIAEEVEEIRKRVRLELAGRATRERLDAARTARRRMPVASLLAAGGAAAALGLSFLLWPDAAPPAGDSPTAELSLPAHIAMAPLVEPLGDEPMGLFQHPGNGLSSSLDMVLVVAEVAP